MSYVGVERAVVIASANGGTSYAGTEQRIAGGSVRERPRALGPSALRGCAGIAEGERVARDLYDLARRGELDVLDDVADARRDLGIDSGGIDRDDAAVVVEGERGVHDTFD